MEVDNISSIIDFIDFRSEDEFYFLQIIKRKKDSPDFTRSESIVKSYYIKSKEHFLKKIDEIKRICTAVNARAYINLNVRSFKKVSLKTIHLIADQLSNESYKAASSIYDSACGSVSANRDKTWIIDVDYNDDLFEKSIKKKIKDIMWKINPSDTFKVNDFLYLRIKTVNGYHLIVPPFDIKKFDLSGVDIHKNNPTLLYCNLSVIK